MYISLENYRGNTLKYLSKVEHAIFYMKKERARWWLFTHTVAVRAIEVEANSMSAYGSASHQSNFHVNKTYSYILHDENDDFVGKLVADDEVPEIAGGDILQINFSVFDTNDLSDMKFSDLKKDELFGVYSVKNLKTGSLVFCDGDRFAKFQLESSPGVGSYIFAFLAVSVVFFVVGTVLPFHFFDFISVLQAEMVGALGAGMTFFVVPRPKNWKPSFIELREKIGSAFENAESNFETKMSKMSALLKAKALRAMGDDM
ncbi:hypothetical protein [Vogesella indigofera]|uniref:hypothetical protein n=1 Tax=Vogesella indigofera TaxID=45465 RepID=UPI00234F5A40|nr:hypothetical protein [Vogesella indigofera]MDC7707184.1 hypothetical protein [Vogesella indigofera]